MNNRTVKPTKTVPVKYQQDFENYPNAGPNPNITGMKRLYWGKDAYCIKCGAYVYNVPARIYNKY